MRYAIIENEAFALQNLQRMLLILRPDYELCFTAESVEECIAFFSTSPNIDVVFMDIELTDGNCFSIFEEVKTNIPIIFTTAYDDFALQAFKVNSIDYLLKPISEDELLRAVEKFEQSSRSHIPDYDMIRQIFNVKDERKRILVNVGDNYSHVDLCNVAYFVRDDKYVDVVLMNGKRYITDFSSLGEVNGIVPKHDFFMLSRNVVVHVQAIKKVAKWFTGRLNVYISDGDKSLSVVVSSARRKDFLDWYGGK